MDQINHAVLQNREQNKAMGRILMVLSSFASSQPGFGISELSQHLGMTKNMVFRAIKTLVEQDYVMRDATGQRYQLGFRVLELQNVSSPEPTFRALCAPAMQQIHEIIGETVSLTVRALDYSVFIDGIETRKPGVWRLQIGALRPLHANATGHVFLAFAEDAEVAAYITRHAHDSGQSRNSAQPPDQDEAINAANLWKEIAVIRKRGYASSTRPGMLPVATLAFPIWDAERHLHGVLSVGGPKERFESQMADNLPRVIAIIETLCQRTRLYSSNAAGSEITL